MNITIAPDVDLNDLSRHPVVIKARITAGPDGKPMIEAFYPSTLVKEKLRTNEFFYRLEREPWGLRQKTGAKK